MLMSLQIQRVAEENRSDHALQTYQGTEKEEDKSRVEVGTPQGKKEGTLNYS